jgi:hypothetical protein
MAANGILVRPEASSRTFLEHNAISISIPFDAWIAVDMAASISSGSYQTPSACMGGCGRKNNSKTMRQYMFGTASPAEHSSCMDIY